MMNSEPDLALYALAYRIAMSHARLWGSCQYQYAKRSYFYKRARTGTQNLCDICHKAMTAESRSIDHIIPVSICIAYDLPALEYHHSNFQLAHKLCNSSRNLDADRFDDLPPYLKRKVLDYQRRGLYQTMGHLPIAKIRHFKLVYLSKSVRVVSAA